MPTPQLAWYPEKFLSELDSKVDNALDQLTDMVRDDAKSTCPVRTGALKESIRKEIDSSIKTGYVGSDLDYSVPVELGTSKREPNPFLRRALDKAQQFWASILG